MAGTEDTHDPAHHVLPLSVYWGVFLALVVGTLVTVWSARIDMGAWNTVIALAIASTKAILVILFFMHVKYSSKLVWLYAAAGFFWMAIEIVITGADYMSRGW